MPVWVASMVGIRLQAFPLFTSEKLVFCLLWFFWGRVHPQLQVGLSLLHRKTLVCNSTRSQWIEEFNGASSNILQPGRIYEH
jgi:hypothetical protein